MTISSQLARPLSERSPAMVGAGAVGLDSGGGISIPLPRGIETTPPFRFPIVATLAPVVVSLAMWAITHSPFALMFAVLGPVIAIGSLVDSRLQARRTSRRELARFLLDAEGTREQIAGAKEAVVVGLSAAVRSPRGLLAAHVHDPERWRHDSGPLPVLVGRGTLPSGITLSGGQDGSGQLPAAATEVVEALRRDASTIDDAPVLLDARLGLGVCGRGVAASSYARGLIMQLAAALSPDVVELRVGEGFGEWAHALPHNRGSVAEPGRMEFLSSQRERADRLDRAGLRIVVALAESVELLPRDCRVGLAVAGGEIALLRHPSMESAERGSAGFPRVLRGELVSAGDAARFASVLREAAQIEGLGAAAPQPPASVAFASLEHPSPPGGVPVTGLPAVFAASADGAVQLDLVTEGPHAIVGGTTGSGKSELLISWVLGMAAAHPPERVTFLLVDFKGGSSFGAVEALPHSVGLITDLDPFSARRALESLRAELRHREQVFARRGARSIDELMAAAEASGSRPALPRLVVVVDEFAAMVADFPELHALFADVAARGRSLGVHLILCTQRPAGALRDNVMANCTLRLSLRVNNGADSTAVIGVPDAAALPPHPIGRAYLSSAGGPPRLAQLAIATAADAAAVSARWADSAPARRPWLAPLPAVLPASHPAFRAAGAEVPEGALAFGLRDLPQEQSQPVAAWHPATEGNLLAVGGQSSGKSSLLAALHGVAGERAMLLPGDVEGAWDALAGLTGAAPESAAPDVLLVDDVDALIGRFGDAQRPLVMEMLTALLRDGGGRGIRVAMTARRLTSAVHSLSGLCDSRILLRMPSRQDHVMAGGEGADHDPQLPPGGGQWRGRRLQIAWIPEAERMLPVASATRCPFGALAQGPLVVISTRAQAIRVLLEHVAPGRVTGPDAVPAAMPNSPDAEQAARIVVADPQEWQLHWAALATLRRRSPLLFDRCTASEFRSLSGSGLVPPPLGREPGGAWLLGDQGLVKRIQLPRGF
ncbi:FtsK/SpoIIIE domain-containing protein [Homoserinimonas aerilata]|uniref:FtsK/SpoIIIE domain-containing protein n=1 Tax=Homoserinimonas aerilata TaxID=1162970 RepID=UPI00163A70F6|nr:FtsK/SpoIIIE domain-containing protein [Homoserinimonas aerilata]